MTEHQIEMVRVLESEAYNMPQVELETTHTFHAGMYARTIKIPAGIMITGALIKIATILICSGKGLIYTSDGAKEYFGYNIYNGMENRKQAFLASEDTYLTMLFPTLVTSIPEAEAEFTDEADMLLTNREGA